MGRISYNDRKYRIKELADAREITLGQVANDVNVHYLTMSQWSSLRKLDNREMRSDHQNDIEQYFGIGPGELITPN